METVIETVVYKMERIAGAQTANRRRDSTAKCFHASGFHNSRKMNTYRRRIGEASGLTPTLTLYRDFGF
jgi:hypothetical protein